MPIYINVRCDNDCVVLESASFDNPAETYGDLLNALRSIGWEYTGDIKSPIMTCPRCVEKKQITTTPVTPAGSDHALQKKKTT